jgi:hypothetical protein
VPAFDHRIDKTQLSCCDEPSRFVRSILHRQGKTTMVDWHGIPAAAMLIVSAPF